VAALVRAAPRLLAVREDRSKWGFFGASIRPFTPTADLELLPVQAEGLLGPFSIGKPKAILSSPRPGVSGAAVLFFTPAGPWLAHEGAGLASPTSHDVNPRTVTAVGVGVLDLCARCRSCKVALECARFRPPRGLASLAYDQDAVWPTPVSDGQADAREGGPQKIPFSETFPIATC